MGAAYSVESGGRRYLVTDDLALTQQLLVVADVADQVTGEPIVAALRVSATPSWLQVRVAPGAQVLIAQGADAGFVGARELTLALGTEGYVPRVVGLSLPSDDESPLRIRLSLERES